MPIWQAVVLGIVQGLTEFLPISSTAHLLLVQEWWFGRSPEQLEKDPITVVIQLGTLFAVFVYYRDDIWHMLKAFLGDLRHGYWISSRTHDGRLAKLIIVGNIPAGLVGLFLHHQLKETFYNATSIGIVAIVFATVMFVSEWWAKRFSAARSDVTLFDAIFIGVFQAFALMPGGSRSGCTITAGLFAGLARPAAARFSFLLSIPIMSAAGAKEIYDWAKTAQPGQIREEIVPLLVGTAVSAVVGYFAIAWLIGYLRRHSMNVFVGYRIALGIIILSLAYKLF
jgi:undecaprenyl-diphosphatase